MNTSGKHYITIEGKKVGLLFALPAIQMMSEKEKNSRFYINVDLDGEQIKSYSQYGMTQIAWAGYINWCDAENIEPEISFSAFYQLIEEAIAEKKSTEIIKPIIDSLHSSRYMNPEKEEKQEADPPVKKRKKMG